MTRHFLGNYTSPLIGPCVSSRVANMNLHLDLSKVVPDCRGRSVRNWSITFERSVRSAVWLSLLLTLVCVGGCEGMVVVLVRRSHHRRAVDVHRLVCHLCHKNWRSRVRKSVLGTKNPMRGVYWQCRVWNAEEKMENKPWKEWSSDVEDELSFKGHGSHREAN